MGRLLEGAEVASYVKLLRASSHVRGLLIRIRYDCGSPHLRLVLYFHAGGSMQTWKAIGGIDIKA